MSDDLLLKAFRLQAGGCRLFGSELYAGILDRALRDVEEGGPVARLLGDFEGDPLRGFLPLRLLGAVHAIVLAGRAPELARHYPTAGGVADAAAAWPRFLALLESHGDELRSRLGRFPQTNEVRRCAGLLGGFLEASRATGLPLRLREIGCSAGLNLQWSRYRYLLGGHRWGDADSPVQIEAEWRGAAAAFEEQVAVESRAGCDLAPPSIEDDEAVRVLESFVWADQPDRLALLRAAIAVWRQAPPRVDTAHAADWLPGELAAPAEGVCTVVHHSSVWIYVDEAERRRIEAVLEERGARATAASPLYWVRQEDGAVAGTMEIRLRAWPGGDERLLGMGHPHGRFVEWRG